MRSGKSTVLVTTITLVALAVATALPVAAQEYEEFEQPALEEPLEGYTRSDGTIVLRDEDYCSYLFGAIWGTDELTFSRLIDRQRRARRAAFQPATDADVLRRCAEVLNAFRLEAPEDDPLAGWARVSPVTPEAIVGLLREDLAADPLAEPDPIGDGARTSGLGDLVSPPFILDSETYLVEVDDTECASWTGSLRDVFDPSRSTEAAGGRSYLYGVLPGTYFWDVSAPGCAWSADLVAVDLGPDPNATPVPQVAVPKLFGENWSRSPGALNEGYLTATQARQAILDAGLTVGVCTEEATEFVGLGRAWAQAPEPGTLLELGSPVDVVMTSDCDIVRGDRVELE